MNKKIVLGIIGNAIEWFCYSLYGAFTANIAYHFFSIGSVHISLLFSYAIFAVGFFMRPVGAVIFGYIGDRVGRENLLFLSMMLMAIPTFCMALIPSFSVIGILAPILLIIMRGLQGIAIGGEYTGAMVYLVEQAPSNKRGFLGSFADFGCLFGTLVGGSLSILAISNIFDEKLFTVIGWRIPFYLSILIVPLAFFIKMSSSQKSTNVSQNLKKKEKKNEVPIIELLKKHYKTAIYVAASSAFSGVNFYTLLVFMPNYVSMINNDTSVGFTSTLITNIVMIPAVLISGFLSDKLRRKPLIIAGIIGVMMFGYPLFSTIDNYTLHVVIEMLFGISLGVYYGGRSAFFAEAFPKSIRCTAVSFSLSISHCIFAGTAPFVATYVAKVFDIRWFYLYIVLVSLFALYGFIKIKDRTGENLL